MPKGNVLPSQSLVRESRTLAAYIARFVSACYRLAPVKQELNYRDCGVDIERAHQSIARIKQVFAASQPYPLFAPLGGFAGAIALPADIPEPILVANSDGVGSKLQIAQAMNCYHTIGIDVVANCVNDILVVGAKPLVLFDYLACHRLDPEVVESIAQGLRVGCEQAACSLAGGECAELPDTFAANHYDLAGFAIGVVARTRYWHASHVQAGDLVLGLRSSGIHSNGLSLARKALLDPHYGHFALTDLLPGSHLSIGEELLRPTRIYEPVFAVLRNFEPQVVRSAAHISGGGLLDNPPRSLPDHLAIDIDLSNTSLPAIFSAIAAQGVSRQEMHHTFNCGIGMILYVNPEYFDRVQQNLAQIGEETWPLGHVYPRPNSASPQVRIRDERLP